MNILPTSPLFDLANRRPVPPTFEWRKLRPEDALVPSVSHRVDGTLDTTHMGKQRPSSESVASVNRPPALPSRAADAPTWQWPLGSLLLSQLMGTAPRLQRGS